MNWFTRLFARKTSAPNPLQDLPASYVLGFVPPDLRLTQDEMFSTSVAWGCLRAIVDPIASSEIKVFTRDVNGSRKNLPDDDIAYFMNVRPCADYTAQAFKEIVLTATVIHGDGYAEIVRNRAGKVSELVPLDAERMRVLRNENDDLVYVYMNPDGTRAALFADEVLHVRGPSIRGLTGESIIYRASKAIALHVAQERFATTYFEKGTVLGGFVKLPGGITEDTRKKLREDLLKKFGGHKRAHGIAFLEAGMDYQPVGSNAGESQLVPSRAFSIEEIARYFGVPLVRLGVQAAAQGYGTNVAQLNLQFVRDTLTPWVNRFTEEATYKLFPERSPWRTIEVDTTWLTHGDDEQRARARQIDIQSGVLSVNEGREQEGRNGVGAPGDLHLVPSTLVVLDEENLTKEQPAAEPASPASPSNEPDDATASAMEAVGRHLRRVKARRADLERHGKTPEEIEANIATTLRPRVLVEIAAAIDGVDSSAAGALAAEEVTG